jgi:hypothetical protein
MICELIFNDFIDNLGFDKILNDILIIDFSVAAIILTILTILLTTILPTSLLSCFTITKLAFAAL